MKGVKHDEGKPQLSLLPFEALAEAAQAFAFGAARYGRQNYTKGMPVTRPVDAALRHISKWANGEDIDPDSGCTHLGCALASLMMAVAIQHRWPEEHDPRGFDDEDAVPFSSPR